jgi:hypothetical protein
MRMYSLSFLPVLFVGSVALAVQTPAELIRSAVTVQAGDAHALAGANAAAEIFVDQPGFMELSGRMIVRPFPMQAWRAAGYTEPQAQQAIARARERLAPMVVGEIEPNGELIIALPAGVTENQIAAYLMATRDYQYAEPDWIVYPQVIPDDPQFGQQYWHNNIRTPAAWDLITGSASVILTNVDTGVRLTHEDLAANLSSNGYNSVSGLTVAQGGDIGPIAPHGTQTAGCIGAVGNNGVGVAGTMWNVTILHVRASNTTSGNTTISALTGGAIWAAQNGARGVSVSYSGVTSSSVGTTGTTLMDTYNSVLLWAAGNNNANLGSSVDWPDVVIVGATDQNDVKASFSAYGRAIDVVAPGVSVRTTTSSSDASYSSVSGTSFSTPIANGVLGLIYSANPTVSARLAMDILQNTARDIGPPGEDDTYGKGIVDAHAAVQYALAIRCPDDWNGDGVVDFNDLLSFLNDYNAGVPRADLNGDGLIDFNDLLMFLNFYNEGCA